MSSFAMFSSLLILSFVTLFLIGDGSFDYYILTLQWPATICASKTCTIPVPDKFTVHGLWPSNRTFPPPVAFCSKVSLPNLATIQQWPIAADLDLYWPNLIGPNRAFWEREWNKHGTCSTLTPKDYFTLTMSLYKDILKVPDLLQKLKDLKGQSVIPLPELQGGYPLPTLHLAFKATLGRGNNDVGIDCEKKSDKKSKTTFNYLKEVKVYIDRVTQAVIPAPMSGNCPPMGTITFPPV